MPVTYLTPLETLSARRGSIATIFADFVRLAACCLAPRHEADGRSLSVREDEYMEVIARYDPREAGLLTEAFGRFIEQADKHPYRDILGTSWLEYSSRACKQARGEFYTPPEICTLMAHLTGGVEEAIAQGRPVRIEEPACGAGGMILAMAELYGPQNWHLPRFTAIDINPVACDMTYINTSIWSVPCEVIWGNAITGKVTRRWPNIHYLRCGEERIRLFRSLIAATRPQAPALPPPSPQSQPPPPSGPTWIQPDLFAA